MVLNSAESVLFTFNEFQQLVGQFPVHSLGFFFYLKVYASFLASCYSNFELWILWFQNITESTRSIFLFIDLEQHG